ncbi:MAG: alpha-1,2-fucosyltransferase [Sphingobacteriaceae bacterium]|nr:MAG: alpha-1,2-fucosyltransferase [Sphingobacteriaceae bacterium]
MIKVGLNGRLGNQLFQYAFAVALSRKYHTFYLISNPSVTDSVKKYFYVRSLSANKWVRRVLHRYAPRKKLGVVAQTGFEEIDEVQCLIGNKIHYEGYFQSIHYFQRIAADIKRVFSIRPAYEKEFTKKYGHLFQQPVLAIHLRIGDYAAWGGDILGGTNMVLPDSYYDNALRQIADLSSYKIIVVTDDVEGAKTKLPTIQDKIIISDQEIVDFQCLMNADKLIISNSTFAWWAAILNKKQAQVFAPEFWLGFKVKKEYPIGIIPESFVKVSF